MATGGVRIRKIAEEHLESVDIPLRKDIVEVERVPIGKLVAEVTGVRQEGDLLIVPIFEEQLVIERRIILKEELQVRLRHEETHHTEQVSLLSERVDIERYRNMDNMDNTGNRDD